MQCNKCGDEIPCKMVIEGRQRNLQRRKFCVKCSPFGRHNTKRDLEHKPIRSSTIKYADWPETWKTNNTNRIHKRRRARKQKIVSLMGGKCIFCGYNKCLKSMDCHHIERETKKFSVSSVLSKKSWNDILHEIKKCLLVCRNCHGEIHDGLITREDVLRAAASRSW